MRTWIYSFLLFGLAACHTTYIPARLEYGDYEISRKTGLDSTMIVLTQPYRDSLQKSMNEVIGWTAATLEKKQPSGTLNNFMADAMLVMGRQKLDPGADAALVNYGGIRLTQLPAGNITRGKVFELMPFDNLLVVQELPGTVLQSFLDLAAAKGGFAVSGLTMQIKNGKAVNVRIGGQPLDPSRSYRIINSDYIVNGGDDASMLKKVPYVNKGYLMRDAISDYIAWLKGNGKTIIANEEKRVAHAE